MTSWPTSGRRKSTCRTARPRFAGSRRAPCTPSTIAGQAYRAHGNRPGGSELPLTWMPRLRAVGLPRHRSGRTRIALLRRCRRLERLRSRIRDRDRGELREEQGLERSTGRVSRSARKRDRGPVGKRRRFGPPISSRWSASRSWRCRSVRSAPRRRCCRRWLC